MTHYYYLIEASKTIDTNTKFFRIGVGTSAQANKDYLFTLAYCLSHGFFFELVSEATDTFVYNVAKSLNCQLADLNITMVPIRDYVRSVKHLGTSPAIHPKSAASIHQRCLVDSNFYFFRRNS